MTSLKWAVIAIASLQGVWLTFDGCRAFVTGNYTTPSSGAHAGQLGPWSKVVAAVGLDPRGMVVRSVHVALGLTWLLGVTAVLLKPSWGWWLLVACSVGSLWYLPFGTVLSSMVLVMLFTPAVRDLMSR